MTRLRGVAERALASGDVNAQREALSTSLEESERILAMLDTLMDISEAETGTMRLALADVDLPTLVGEVVSVYEDVAEDKELKVRTEIEPDLRVTGDRDRLRQVLANLLDNAIKYTPRGGEVSIRGRAEGTTVVLDVADTGAGISQHDLPRIWERLYRGDQSRAERGLGLGLSLVKAIVAGPRRHGRRHDAARRRVNRSRFASEGSLHRCNAPVTARQSSRSSYSVTEPSRRTAEGLGE